MFKIKTANKQMENIKTYGLNKKKLPRFQWYVIALILCTPIVYLVVKLVYDNFYPHATGVVTAEEFVINSPENGFVRDIFISQGNAVKAGQLLLSISSPELESKIVFLKKSIARLQEQKRDFKNMDLITLKKIRQIALSEVLSNEKYYIELQNFRESGVVTLLQLNDARNEYVKSQNYYAEILAKIKQSEEDFAVKQYQIFDDDIRQLQEKLDEVLVKQSILNIHAPIDGSLKHMFVHKGEYVSDKKEGLAVIASDHNFRILAFLDSKYLANSKVGGIVKIILPDNTFVNGTIENIPSFTDRLYKGIDLINDTNRLKIVVVIKPAKNFPLKYRINGVEVTILF